MKIFKLILTSASCLILGTSSLFAGVTTSAPANTNMISKIASSTSFSSANNNNMTTSEINKSTSAAFDMKELKKGVEATAAKYGLTVDESALAALAAYSESGGTAAAREKMLATVESNVSEAAADQSQEKTPDTWVYTNDEMDLDGGSGLILTKATSYDGSDYSSSNDVFDSTAGAQRFWGATYVDFKKKSIWAEMKTQVTYADGSSTVKTARWTTDSGAITSSTIVAELNWEHTGPAYTGSDAKLWSGTGFDDDVQSLQKANDGGFADSCCGDADVDLFRWYNHQGTLAANYDSDKSAGDVFGYAKIVIPNEGSAAEGIIAIEGSNCTIASGTCAGADAAAKEAAFIEKLERYSATVTVTARKAK